MYHLWHQTPVGDLTNGVSDPVIHVMKYVVPFVFAAVPAFAQECPPVSDTAELQAQILAELSVAPTPADAQVLNRQLWSIWTDAPDAAAQALLNEGMARRSSYDFLGSREVLGRLVDYCPDYAEGYNQRAFTNYLARDFEAALVDLDITLDIVPAHLGALSGKALTLMGLERFDEAQEVLRTAVALNPWMSERALLTEPIGTDL